ncbi:hypothetical protein [Deinococcus radiodurans]|uniref:hypothetical protein n=1 Tax=Deinococcus radiodurans TaxID=1299 RepID=UPI001FB756B1|nr:hypothetical protein [Deinococcus radiodurans]
MTIDVSARDVTIELVRAASVTNTAGEQAFPETLLRVLGRLPYFQAHPEDLWTQPIENDPYGRRNVYALVRGTARRGWSSPGITTWYRRRTMVPTRTWPSTPRRCCPG